MKKNFLYIGILLGTILSATGCTDFDTDLTGGINSVEVKTTEVGAVDYDSAEFPSPSHGFTYGGNAWWIIVISENEDLSNPIYENNYTGRFYVNDLKSGTTYYYQEYLRDSSGYKKKGEIKQFTTTNYPY